jgi:peptidoglycan/xylan/chitin deacetylase (PgdA/CDA1 family)
MNWRQVKEMHSAGIEFGSHTVSHPYLANLTVEELNFELMNSKIAIESQLGTQVYSIAYPFGNYSARVMECSMKNGYHFGISYEHNTWKYGRMNDFAIPRIHVESDVTLALFRANLFLPQIFVELRT